MAGGKTTPRQKMINMMYLVLTALLALNVSKEIIKAFNLIENSLNTSTSNIKAKNEMTLKAIGKEENESAKAALAIANEAKKITDQFEKNMDAVKTDLEDLSGGRKKDPEALLVKGGVPELSQGDNMEVHANYFLLENKPNKPDGKAWSFAPSGKMRGDAIFESINKTREDLLALLDKAVKDPNLGGKDDKGETKKLLEEARKNLKEKTALVAENGKNSDGREQKWVSMYLEHSPLAGVFALLSKYVNDARSLESEVTATLAKAVNASDFKFDKLAAVISAPNSAIMQNQTYEADIMLAAYNSKAQMNITVGGSPVEIKDGIGKYKVTGGSPGEFNYKVNIAVPGPGGKVENLTAEAKYSVFPPMAAISADELNVFYVGLDNPISVAVAGVDSRNVAVSASAGNLQNVGGGRYKVLFPARQGNESVISVSAKMGDGRVVPMGSKKFKIRNVPRPVFRAGAISFDKPVQLSALMAQSSAVAILENFVYDGVKYTVQGFTFTGIGRTGPKKTSVQGSSLQAIKGILGGMRAGEFVMFSDIRAVGPSGPVFLENVSGMLQ
jgi:gliding motility-associated protein GldM